MQLHPQDLSIEAFNYILPDEKIARYPLAQRDQSKLLIYRDGQIEESTYAKLDAQLPTATLLVFNNTKVVEARLLFQKDTGSKIELFCLEPADQYPDITTAMLQKGGVTWKCLVGGAKKWKSGRLTKSLTFGSKDQKIVLSAEKVEKQSDSFLISFSWDQPTLSFAEVLHLAGQLPLPPYLNRAVEPNDLETYQTVYAKYDGSVAAPTAGLHFTPALLQKLQTKGITESFVTLHVGAGTFKPVKANRMEDHEMHAEFMEIPVTFISELLAKLHTGKGKVITVGTTSLRTVESLYWIGVKLLNKDNSPLIISQWEPYSLPQEISATQALQALLDYLQQNSQEKLFTHTQIIIAPGYRLRISDGIITNFHQPKSTLLLLIAAVVGENWREIYQYALDRNFRFLSYGDGSLLWKQS